MALENSYPSLPEFFADYVRAREAACIRPLPQMPLVRDFHNFFSSWAYLQDPRNQPRDFEARFAINAISSDVPEIHKILSGATGIISVRVLNKDDSAAKLAIESLDICLAGMQTRSTPEGLIKSYAETRRIVGGLKTISADTKGVLTAFLISTKPSRAPQQFHFPTDPEDLEKLVAERTKTVEEMITRARVILNSRSIPDSVAPFLGCMPR